MDMVFFPEGDTFEELFVRDFFDRFVDELGELVPFMTYSDDGINFIYAIHDSLVGGDKIMELVIGSIGSIMEVTIITGATHLHVSDDDRWVVIDQAIDHIRDYLVGGFCSVLYLEAGEHEQPPIYEIDGQDLYYAGGTTLEIEEGEDLEGRIEMELRNFRGGYVMVEKLDMNRFFVGRMGEDGLEILKEEAIFDHEVTPIKALQDGPLGEILKHVGKELAYPGSVDHGALREMLLRLDGDSRRELEGRMGFH
ncbi:MAG: hypothetical protein D6732_21055 [Methanobacteriota archaeon]|nr:MAG: hypothetical protein D6732_21055 [Euryarchaeota archaeon]